MEVKGSLIADVLLNELQSVVSLIIPIVYLSSLLKFISVNLTRTIWTCAVGETNECQYDAGVGRWHLPERASRQVLSGRGRMARE